MQLDETYKDKLVTLYKNPPNKGKLAQPTVTSRAAGSSCGDIVDLQLVIKDGMITEAVFDGPLCIFSTAASSYLTTYIKGKTVSQAKELTVEALIDYMNVHMATSRRHCATIAIKALHKALEAYDHQTQTDPKN